MSRLGLEYGFSWALEYLLVASWIWVAHNYGSEIRKMSHSGLKAFGTILLMSAMAALFGGGFVAYYQPTRAKALGAVTAAFLISFVPAILEGPGKK